jgi:hypothetical protein
VENNTYAKATSTSGTPSPGRALNLSRCFTELLDGEDYPPGMTTGNRTHEAENKGFSETADGGNYQTAFPTTAERASRQRYDLTRDRR